jgi:hypothetical protein
MIYKMRKLINLVNKDISKIITLINMEVKC